MISFSLRNKIESLSDINRTFIGAVYKFLYFKFPYFLTYLHCRRIKGEGIHERTWRLRE